MTIVRYWMAAAVVGLLLMGTPSFAAESKLINLNTATAAELTTLKGIGDAKAKAIVDHRDKNGPFKSVDDLKNVAGIGDKMLASLRPQLTTGEGGPTAPHAPAGPAAAAAKQ